MGRAGVDKATHPIAGARPVSGIRERLNGALDRGWVTPDGGAVLVKYRILVFEVVNRATDEVPDVGISGNYAKRKLLTTAADDKGRMWFLDGLWARNRHP